MTRSGEGPVQELERLFHPRSVAVVGVTDRVTNQGLSFLKANRAMGFKGPLYAIHPDKRIPGFETYPSLLAVPGPVDYVIIAIPAAKVGPTLEECVHKGAHCVTVFSSGFRESLGREGEDREERLREILARGRTRLLGPNCMGLYCPEAGLSIRPEVPGASSGNIGLICQSGGITISLILAASSKGLGISKAVSYGNELDLGAPAFLHYLARDPKTEVIGLYLEGARRPGDLRASLADAASRKPVILLKGGATGPGALAASSHTGALAGAAQVWKALAAQAGAIMVQDLDELLDLAGLYSLSQPPAGQRLGILTISGGLGVVAADLAATAGFDLPPFHPSTQRALAKIMKAPGTSVQNPVDMAAQFYQPHLHREIFTAVDADPGIDALILVGAMEYLGAIGSHAGQNAHLLANAAIAAMKHLTKPVYVVLLHTAYDDRRAELETAFARAGFPVFPALPRCLRALKRSLIASQRDKPR